MTFNRKNQINILEKLYNSKDNDAVIFYSSIDSDIIDIVKEFITGKDIFYYKAVQTSSEEQLKLFVNSINRQLINSEISDISYSAALKAMLEEKCEKRVIIIDEFQYIIKYSDDLLSEIRKCVNNKWDNQPVLFVFVSTNSYFVEHLMPSVIDPSLSDFIGRYRVPDLSFLDIVQNFPKYKKTEQIITYAITGGKAKRIMSFDSAKSLKENIINSVISEDGFLYLRGMNILPPELREFSVYNTILCNIANGCVDPLDPNPHKTIGNTKLSVLHDVTGYSRAKISVYINNLIDHNLIEKINSFDSDGRDNTIKGVYAIKDDFLAFFYRFVFPNLSLLKVISKEEFYDKYIAPGLINYSRTTFNKVCNEYMNILNHIGKLPIRFTSNGTWIGKEGTIDLLYSDDLGHTIVCMCEFENDEMRYKDFEWLMHCLKQAKIKASLYYLFTRKGFDKEILSVASEMNNITLIDLSML